MRTLELRFCNRGSVSFDEMRVFAVVARAGTFAAAGRQLGVPKSTLTRSIARLEARTRVALLYRSARSFTLTEDGRRFLDAIGPHVAALDEATRALHTATEQPEGTLRVSAPLASGDLLGDAMARFVARYPRLRLDIDLSGRMVDIVGEGFDAALRATRTLRGDALTARKLLAGEVGLFAAPTYLARRGPPEALDDLRGHDLVAHAPTLLAAPPRPPSVQRAFAAARIAVNEFAFVRSLLRAGAGIGPLAPYLAASDVAEGRLVRVLPDWSYPIGTVYLVYPTARQLPRKVEVFRDFMLEAFRNLVR